MNFSGVGPRATINAVNIKAPALYCLSMYSAKMPLLWEICVKGVLSEMPCDITLKISVDSEAGQLLSPCLFTYEQKSIFSNVPDYHNRDFYASFDYEDLAPFICAGVLQSLVKPQKGKINIEVTIGAQSAGFAFEMDLYPYNVWHGLGFNPSLVASYVLPGAKAVENTVKGIKVSSDTYTLAKELYRKLREKKLVYERASDNFCFEKAYLCLADSFYKKQIGMYTPIELSLFFACCAQSAGLKPVICFFKGERGNSLCYVGIKTRKECMLPPVCEENDVIEQLVEKEEILLIDPASFTAGHETDFDTALRSAKLKILSETFTLLCACDIESARLSGIVPMLYNDISLETKEKESGLLSKKLFQYEHKLYTEKLCVLTDFFKSQNKKLPLFMPDFDSFVQQTKTKDLILSCPDFVNISHISALDGDFCSLYTTSSVARDLSGAHGQSLSLNISQEKDIRDTVSMLRQKLYCENTVYSPLCYEEFMSGALSQYVCGQGKDICLMAGFAKLEKEGKTTILPLIIYKGSMEIQDSKVYFEYAPEGVIFNLPAIIEIAKAAGGANVFEAFEKATSISLYIKAYEALCSYVNTKGAGINLELIKEAYICSFDTDDFYKWLDLWQNIEQYVKNKLLQDFACGKAEVKPAPEASADDSQLTKYLSPLQKGAVGLRNAAITARVSSGKKTLLCCELSNNIKSKKTSLVFVKSQESADGILKKAQKFGFDKKILALYGKNLNVSSLKQRATWQNNKQKTDTVVFNSQNIYSYEYAIHKKYNFGLSFYDCVYNYRKYREISKSAKTLPSLSNYSYDLLSLDKDGFSDLLCCADNLVNTASAANSAISRLKALSLDGHPLYCLQPENNFSLSDGVKEAFCNLSQSSAFIKPRIKEAAQSIGLDCTKIKSIPQLFEVYEIYHSAAFKPLCILPCKSEPRTAVEQLKQKKYAITRIRAIEEILAFLRPEALCDGLPENARPLCNTEGKSFMERKNIKKEAFDICSHLVYPERKSEFMKMALGDTFALCDEYKERQKTVCNIDRNEYDIICASCDVYSEVLLHCVKLSLEEEQISRVFECVYNFPADNEKAKELCECLSEVCSLTQKLSNTVGFNPARFEYEGGIFEGEQDFSKRVAEAYVNLDGFEQWCDFCVAKKTAALFGLEDLAVFIEKNGLTLHTKEAFYACIYKVCCDVISPLLEGISRDFIQNTQPETQTYENTEAIQLLNKAQSVEELLSFGLCKVTGAYPVIIADAQGLCMLERQGADFDSVYIYDAHRQSIYDCAGAICSGKEFVLIGNQTKNKTSVLNTDGLYRYYLDKQNYTAKGEITALCNSLFPDMEKSCGIPSKNRQNSFEVLFAEGRFDRNDTRTNIAEIRLLCDYLKKKYEGICGDKADFCNYESVNIVALTKSQQRGTLLYFTSREGSLPEITTALKAGLINVVSFEDSHKLTGKETILMTVFAKDKEAVCPMETVFGSTSFKEELFAIISSTQSKLTIITSFEKDMLEMSYHDSNMILLCRLIKSCNNKYVYHNAKEQNNGKGDKKQSLKEFVAADLKVTPEYRDCILNTQSDVAHIEVLDSNYVPTGAVFTDKAHMSSLQETLFDAQQYKKAGYEVVRCGCNAEEFSCVEPG